MKRGECPILKYKENKCLLLKIFKKLNMIDFILLKIRWRCLFIFKIENVKRTSALIKLVCSESYKFIYFIMLNSVHYKNEFVYIMLELFYFSVKS